MGHPVYTIHNINYIKKESLESIKSLKVDKNHAVHGQSLKLLQQTMIGDLQREGRYN